MFHFWRVSVHFFCIIMEKGSKKRNFFSKWKLCRRFLCNKMRTFSQLALAMSTEKEIICSIALSKIFGFEPRIALAILENLGSAAALFDLSPSARDELLGPYSKYRGQLRDASLQEAHADYEQLIKQQAYFLPYTDVRYPSALKDIADPPVGLYVRSETPPEQLFSQERVCVALVGTRKATPYGLDMCSALVEGFACVEPPPVVVSGLAYGVDICAHRAALQAKVPTLAVMASGVDAVYPYRHQREAEQMVHTPGCALLSDYSLKTAPLAINFVRRNRIIAGLSRHTILVESKQKGGGMITARLAFDYGRELFAVPGRVGDVHSQGCNYLIANKMAEPILSVESALSALGFGTSVPRSSDCQHLADRLYSDRLSASDMTLAGQFLMQVRATPGMSLGDISRILRCSEVKLTTLATLLEADGLIEVDLLKRCRILR